jgi:hypothetical protein
MRDYGGQVQARKTLCSCGYSTWEPLLLASGDGRDDADFIARFDSCFGVLEESDVFVVYEYIYETADVTLFIANAFFETRITEFEVFDYILDRCALDFDDFQVLSQFAERSRNTNWYRHKD